MKKRRFLALLLTTCMVLGQNVLAEDVMNQESVQQIEEENAAKQEKVALEEPVVEQATVSVQEEEANVNSDSDKMSEKNEVVVVENEEVASSEVEERTLYTNYPVIDKIYVYGEGDSTEYTVKSENEEICKVFVEGVENSSGINLEFEGISEGTTTINLYDGAQNLYESYLVTVKVLPEDAVVFKDIVFRSNLIFDGGVDENRDGYISIGEMSAVTELYISNYSEYDKSITDLTGLEYAKNLQTIQLKNHSQLENIDVLLNMEHLDSVDLRGTKVPDEARWMLAAFQDFEMLKGEQRMCPNKGYIFEEALSIEVIEGNEFVEIMDKVGRYAVVAKNVGNVKLKITYNNLQTEITVDVQGIEADQEVGETSDASVVSGRLSRILSSNGVLWDVYPEPAKVQSDVQKYVGGWVYSGADILATKYYLDSNNVLWSNDVKLAEDIKDFNAHYALDAEDTLIDIYNNESINVDNVSKWIEATEYDDYTYVLKKDGTLWRRQEVEKETSVNEFEMLEDNVKQMKSDGYLKNDGNFYDFDGTLVLEDIESLADCGAYYGIDGNCYYYDSWERLSSLGQVRIKAYCWDYNTTPDDMLYYLTEEGELYKYMKDEVPQTKIASDVDEIFSYPATGVIVYRLNDGTYRNITGEAGTEELPIVIQTGFVTPDDVYQLLDNGVKNDYILERNGVTILTHVKEMWRDQDRRYVTRTDGTVWDVTDVPKLIIDLNTETVIKGDLNDDGTINIEDLRIILGGVCEKVELTEEQVMAADIIEDGSVDIQDLRQELRYVCGKIDSLE